MFFNIPITSQCYCQPEKTATVTRGLVPHDLWSHACSSALLWWGFFVVSVFKAFHRGKLPT